jgi:hypothetical protein
MIDQDRKFPPTEPQWVGWPTDVLHSALAVIATTRCEWAVRGAADAPDTDHARFARPLFSLALDAVGSSAGRVRGMRVRSRRRTSPQFAT